MGQITDGVAVEGREREKQLHRKLVNFCTDQGEWLKMEPHDVLDALKWFSPQSYITVRPEPFEIVSFD